MANYWSIVIGMNQYQHFPPLMYAQRDAYAFREFLTKEAFFPAKQSFLLSDISPRRHRTETFPTRDSIQACLTRTCQQRLQPGDFLWCFFSGYGVQLEGKDYLMPIDGHPDEIGATGIPIERLFSTFETAPTQNIILVLDVNRNQSIAAGHGLGDQTALLAREHGIPTVLSCLPNQFAHETLTLRHGLFTVALLEALRQGCVTLEQLAQHLGYRLPDLSEQHWRPRQEPLAIIPPEKRFQLIVPEKAAITLGTTVERAMGGDRFASVQDFVLLQDSSALYDSTYENVAHESGVSKDSRYGSPAQEWMLSESGYPPSLLDPSWQMISPRDVFAEPTAETTRESGYSLSAVPDTSAVPQSSLATPNDVADALFWRRMLTWSSIIAAALLIGVVVRNAGQPAEQLDSTAGIDSVSSGVSNSSPEIDRPGIQAAPGSALESAYLEVRSRNYIESKQFLDQVPLTERDPEFDRVMEQANRGLLSDAKIQLSRTRELTEENQAADFADAIGIAQQVRPGEPRYEEAQQYIARWSQVILDMAQGRADRRNDSSTSLAAENYSTAIATVRLIPQDSPDVYGRAQEAIAQWSQRIFDLASARADEAKYDVAVQTAELIPPDAPVYQEAQTAIAQWREQPSLLIIPTP